MDERINEILNSMHSFSKESYYKRELLSELLSLQSEMVAVTFNKQHVNNAELRIWDVIDHLSRLNNESGHIADTELRRFNQDSLNVCNRIKGEILGNKGERAVESIVRTMFNYNQVLTNIELGEGTDHTEIDTIVITATGLHIIEVKNTSKDIFIDGKGNYYRTGEFLRWDCNIVEKMGIRERVLKRILMEAGVGNINISTVVVFTNDRAEIQCKCKEIRTCFINQLCYIISESSDDICYTDQKIEEIRTIIEAAINKKAYPIDFDVHQYKKDFVLLVTLLEDASAKLKNREEDIDTSEPQSNTMKSGLLNKIRNMISTNQWRFIVGAAVIIGVGIVSSIVTSKVNEYNR